MRVAALGFLHETNTFAERPTSFADFTEDSALGKMLLGEDVLDLRETNTGMGGFLTRGTELGFEIVPVGWCEAEPGGTVTEEAFDRITALLVQRLGDCGAIDAIFLDLHGAMVARSQPDAELEVVRRIRRLAGDGVPIVAALDLHGNISPDFVAACQGLSAYRTYPHIDMAETGARCANQIAAIAQGRGRTFGVRLDLPFFIPMHEQSDTQVPCREIYARLAGIEAECDHAVDLSFLTGFYAADTYWAGPSILAYAEREDDARRAAQQLVDYILSSADHFANELLSVDEAVTRAQDHSMQKPLVLAEVQDNPGCGGTADAMSLIAALAEAGVEGAAASAIHDPAAVAQAWDSEPGDRIALSVGGKSGFGAPLSGAFTLEWKGPVRFRFTGPMATGQVIDLGRGVRLGWEGVGIVVTEKRVQNLDLGFFEAAGIVAQDARVLIVKSTLHYLAAYGPIAAECLPVASPGLFPMDPGELKFQSLRPGMAASPREYLRSSNTT